MCYHHFMDIDRLFRKPVKEIVCHLPIEACYFFGSQQTDYVNDESDYDFALFVKNKKEANLQELIEKIVVDFHSSEKLHLSIVDLYNTSPTFLYQIIKKGVLIYKKDNFNQTSSEAFIMRLYFDDLHRNNIYFHYLKRKYVNR